MRKSLAIRIKELTNYLDISVSALEAETGITNGTIGKALKRESKSLSEANNLKIKAKYSWISMQWLETGIGEMKQKEQKGSDNDKEKDNNDEEKGKLNSGIDQNIDNEIEEIEKELLEVLRENQKLRKEIEMLRRRINEQ